MNSDSLLWTIAVATHVFAVISWVGAMYFNLTLLFPMYRSRGPTQYVELMMEQGTRAYGLLYTLVGLTAVSGCALAFMSDAWTRQPGWLLLKAGLWALMLFTHLIGTLRIWPRVFFALPSETDGLFLRYRVWMAVSATAGTLAVFLSILQRVQHA